MVPKKKVEEEVSRYYDDSEERRYIDRIRTIAFKEARDAGAGFINMPWVAHRLQRSVKFVHAYWNRGYLDCKIQFGSGRPFKLPQDSWNIIRDLSKEKKSDGTPMRTQTSIAAEVEKKTNVKVSRTSIKRIQKMLKLNKELGARAPSPPKPVPSRKWKKKRVQRIRSESPPNEGPTHVILTRRFPGEEEEQPEPLQQEDPLNPLPQTLPPNPLPRSKPRPRIVSTVLGADGRPRATSSQTQNQTQGQPSTSTAQPMFNSTGISFLPQPTNETDIGDYVFSEDLVNQLVMEEEEILPDL